MVSRRCESSPRRRASPRAIKPPTTIPMAIVMPCQARVIGRSSMVGSIPIVMTPGTAITGTVAGVRWPDPRVPGAREEVARCQYTTEI